MKENNFSFVYTENKYTRAVNKKEITDGNFYPSSRFIKPLKKLWKSKHRILYNRNNTIIIDDTEYTYERNYGNALKISDYSFYYDKNDQELVTMVTKLEACKEKLNRYGSVRNNCVM